MLDSNSFFATIEFISGQFAAILSFTDRNGEWAGGGRLELRPRAFESTEAFRARLYEFGYTSACATAAGKGGHLETYRVIGT